MILWTIFKVAVKSLWAHKLRAFLAMLGIIIGVGAVISMLALGAGAQASVMERVSQMGTNLVVVRPGQGGHRGRASGAKENLSLKDAADVVAEVRGVESASPVVRGSAQIKYFAKNVRHSINGVASTYPGISNYKVEKGRFFTEGECEQRRRVCVLGAATATALFEGSDPIGETVKIKSVNFEVIGVLVAKGDQGFSNPDEQAMVPYTVAMKQLFGQQNISDLSLQVEEGYDQEVFRADVGKVLRRNHRLQPEAEDDFHVRSQQEILETATSISQTFTVLLGGIASISLLVGGIGIMNIMLVTVTERTREIGIRKAIGAKDRDILRQFLIEAMIMTGLGGILGVLAGMGIANTIERFSTFKAVIETSSVLLSLGFSCAIGIFFGYYPAWSAAQLDPIDALRYE